MHRAVAQMRVRDARVSTLKNNLFSLPLPTMCVLEWVKIINSNFGDTDKELFERY